MWVTMVHGSPIAANGSDLLIKRMDFLGCGLLALERDLSFEVLEVFRQLRNLVVLLRKLALEFKTNLLTKKSLHQVVVVLESLEFSRGHIQLVDHLVSLLRHLGVDHHVQVLQELFTLASVVNDLHLLQVDQVMVLALAHGLRFTTASELFLPIFEQLLAEYLQTLVEVFH